MDLDDLGLLQLPAPRTGAITFVRGSDGLRAWCDGCSLHADVVVPDYDPASSARKQLRALVPDADPATAANPRCPASGAPAISRRRRLPWADLLRRVFAQDVLACPCGGRRTVTAFVVDTNLARSVLTALRLAAEPATFAPARDPPQAEFAWDDPA